MKNQFENLKKETESEIALEDNLNIVPGDKLEELDIPPSEFLIRGLVPLNGISVVSGKPCSFKSWILLLIAREVALGKPLFDQFETKQKRVLYLDEESSLAEQKRRWLMVKGSNPTPVYFSSMAGFKIDNRTQREYLLALCKKNDFKVLIVDSLRDVHHRNENDSKDAQAIIDAFREFIQQGITIIISHHNRKESFLNPKDPSQMLRGSDALLAGLDALLAIENPKATEEAAELIITQAKLRQGRRTDPFKVNIFEKEGKMLFEYTGKIATEESKMNEAKSAIKELLKQEGELYQKQIIEYLVPLNHSPATIRRAIKEMKDEELQTRMEGQKLYFSNRAQ